VEGDRARFSWLGLIGAGLIVALLTSALVQARQHGLLKRELRAGEDYAVLLVYQAETEYMRLREQWLRAVDERMPLDRAALRLRYEIWVSRIELLAAERPQRLIGAHEESRQTLEQVRQFIHQADRGFTAPDDRGVDRTFVVAMWPALEELGASMHALSLGAAYRVAEASEQRADAVRAQNQLGIALTVFLSLLTLAFVLVALRHLRDLRQRRLALENLATELRAARREAEAASEAKSVFLANISHEIRTPFHGLMGMLSLLRETGLTPRQADYLQTATESADHLLAILNDILDMSQLESGRMTLAPAPVELRSLLHDVEALMRPQAAAKHLALHIDIEPDVPERLLADATRVKQVVFNLLSNAIKFSERGAVLLEVRRSADGQRRPTIEFQVTDTGIGMDEATQAKLFRRFVQGDTSRSRRHGGTGLGLEISRNLARMMGGDITVRSKLGEGSSFTFRMLLAEVRDTVASADRTAADARATRQLRVLVAEDHPVNRQYMAALLETMGHHAHFTTNGEEAVQAARERRFDIILMDLHMPVLDGVAATRAIRALPDPAVATVPIVALTADAFPETLERCLVAGMNDFLTKPVSPQKLGTSLRRLFGAGVAVGIAPDAPAAAPPPGPEDSMPLIDEGAVTQALQGMTRDRLAALIDEFLAQGPQTVQHLRAAMRDAQPLELRVHAHAAKGAALNLGLSALAATAEALHQGAAHLPAHEIARLVQRYEGLLNATRAATAASGLSRPAGSSAD
jgi:hypothetical protein